LLVVLKEYINNARSHERQNLILNLCATSHKSHKNISIMSLLLAAKFTQQPLSLLC